MPVRQRPPITTGAVNALIAIALLLASCTADEEELGDLGPPIVGIDPGHNQLAVPMAPEQYFVEITSWSGLNIQGTGEGLAVWDVDADGYDDVILPGKDRSFVLRNRGDGSFYPLFQLDHEHDTAMFPYLLDLTGDGVAELLLIGSAGPRLLKGYANGGFRPLDGVLPEVSPTTVWSVATFGDVNGDGRHDIYLGKMSEYDPSAEQSFAEDRRTGDDCVTAEDLRGRVVEEPAGVDQLLLGASGNDLADITETSGLNRPHYTQAAMTCDLDGDGHLDVLVGTEGSREDAVYFGDGTGGFAEKGVALGMSRPTSAMGYDAADLDHNGELDLYVTDEAVKDGDKLYMQSNGTFTFATLDRGLELTKERTGWGLGFHDLDNDGHLDLFVANGLPLLGCPGGEQLNLLYTGDASGHFTHLPPTPGSGLNALLNSRAALFSDLDHDGDLDILVSNINAPPTILRNDFAFGHWLQLVLHHPTLIPAVGTRITLTTADGTTMRRDVKGTPSYGGSSGRAVHFGLGEATSVASLVVRWPDGSEQTVAVPGVDRFLEVTKGAP